MGVRWAAAILCVALAACGGSSPTAHNDAGPDGGADAGIHFIGQLGQPAHIQFDGWIPTLRVSSGSVTTTALLDTGSPLVFLDATTFGLAPGPRNIGLAAFGGMLSDLPVVAFDLSQLGGGEEAILGGTLWSSFALAIDYKGANAYLQAGGHPEVPSDIPSASLGAPAQVPFELRGGGLASFPGCDAGCPVPATRVTLSVVVEGGQPVWMMLDTGSVWVALDSAFAAGLPDAGRPRLDGITAETISGPKTTYMTRLASISVGASVDASEPVLVLPDGDTTFASLSAETGVPVVGLIGGGFLRRRVTVIDYVARELLLAPYLDNSHIDPNEFVQMGFLLVPNGTTWVVGDVYRGTSAEQVGLVRGDVITRINGTTLAGLDSAAVLALFYGHSLGDLVTVTVQRPSGAVDLVVAVENLLPEFTLP